MQRISTAVLQDQGRERSVCACHAFVPVQRLSRKTVPLPPKQKERYAGLANETHDVSVQAHLRKGFELVEVPSVVIKCFFVKRGARLTSGTSICAVFATQIEWPIEWDQNTRHLDDDWLIAFHEDCREHDATSSNAKASNMGEVARLDRGDGRHRPRSVASRVSVSLSEEKIAMTTKRDGRDESRDGADDDDAYAWSHYRRRASASPPRRRLGGGLTPVTRLTPR